MSCPRRILDGDKMAMVCRLQGPVPAGKSPGLLSADHHGLRSRYLLAYEGLDSTKAAGAFLVFERVFREFGLPTAMRTDNGGPFSSPHALFNLSKLSGISPS
jgi:hypothetical protein